MSEPRQGHSYVLIAGLIAAAAMVTWLALVVYNRPAVEGTAATRPGAAPVVAPSVIRPTPGTSPPPPASTAAVSATGEVVNATEQDQRQVAKITQGLTTNPSGGILVEAAPPGSIASQLRVEAGDVIVAVNGDRVTSAAEFARIYREQGLPRQMSVIHNGREMHHH